VIQSWYNYGVSPNGTRWAITYTGPAGLASPVWQRTTTDLLGRTIRTEQPGFGGSVLVSSNFFDTANHLVRTTSSSAGGVYAVTLYAYDSLGAQTRSGLDLNLNGIIDLSGPDRVTESRSWYETDSSNNYWQVSASILYPHDGSAAPVTNAIQRTRLTGLGSNEERGTKNQEQISIDLLGNQTLSSTFVDPATRTVTQTTTYPDSTNAATQVTVNGLTQYSISQTGVRTDYAYDALSRQISTRVDAASPPRSVGSYTHYNSRGQVDWVADALSNRTTFAYAPITGQRIAVTDALSNTTYTAYDPEGRVIATWGATYPVAYAYDAYGRMVVMATFRVEGGSGDQTQWLYDGATGLLTNKVYADGKGPSYTYTPDGKLATRTWARGVQTTYRYATDGAMTNIVYSDGTPAVSFTLDRLGRQKVAQTFLSAHHFAYSPSTLALVSETIIDLQTGASNVIARTTDALGRPAGLSLGADYSVGYTFDDVGRFGSVTGFADGYSLTNRYGYLPGSDLLAGWSNGVVTVARSFEPNRDLLVQVLNMAGANRVNQFDYLNDAIGRRTQRLDTLAGYALPVTNEFGYNPRSELTRAAMGTNKFGYVFDSIGNRELERVNLTTNVYAANDLNQYTNILCVSAPPREDTPIYDADGNILKLRDWTLQWDAENRLVSASNATEVIHYQHDFMGRRVWRAAAGVTNHFDYDGWSLIRERTYTQTHTRTNTYFFGPDLSGELQGAGTIGGLWAQVGEGGPLCYTYDGNGNVSDLVDASGTIRGHYEYAPFGGLTAMTGDIAASNPFRFSTKRQDEATGLLYYGYRDLDTVWGRWVSRDPLGRKGSLLLHGFVHNDPLDRLDFFGLKAKYPKPKDQSVTACKEVTKKWNDGFQYPDVAPDTYQAWWNYYVTNLKNEAEVTYECDDCCDPDGNPGKLEWSFLKTTCPIWFCVSAYEKEGDPSVDDFIQIAVHELTHCSQRVSSKETKDCKGCICNEMQALFRDAPGAPEETIRQGALMSCGKYCTGKGKGGKPKFDEAFDEMYQNKLGQCQSSGNAK
jgi:RHS repeat-associated protein